MTIAEMAARPLSVRRIEFFTGQFDPLPLALMPFVGGSPDA
jgi:hypothetical protein